MGGIKIRALLLITIVVAIAAAADAQSEDCFCPCMRDQCMTIPGASRDDCAAACDKGCSEANYPGRYTTDDFCGF